MLGIIPTRYGWQFLIKTHTPMVKVYFEMDNGKYAELVAIFADEEMYGDCFPALEKLCKKYHFDIITESVEDEKSLDDIV